MKLVLAVFLTLVCWVSAGHAVQTGLSSDDDSRLLQKITIEARKQCVVDVLHELSKMSHVDLRAGKHLRDYKVRDRKIYVFAKDVPLADLMTSIALSTKLTWKLEGDENKRVYRLYMDPKTLRDEEDRRRARTEEVFQQRKDQTVKLFDEFAKMDGLSQGELTAMKESNPVLYRYAVSGLGAALAELAEQAPEIKMALVEGKELVIDCNDLKENQWQALTKAMINQNNYIQMMRANPLPSRPVFTPDDDARIYINENRVFDPAGCNRLGSVTIRNEAVGRTGFTLQDPKSDRLQFFTRAHLKAVEQGKDRPDFDNDYFRAAEKAGCSDNEMYGLQEPLIKHEKDPALQKKLEMKINATDDGFGDALSAISVASGLAVVADCFNKPNYSDVGGGDLEQVLKFAQDRWSRNWEKHADVIAFRDRRWFEKLDWVIPEATIERWREALQQKGFLDIDHLVEITQLTPEQEEMNVGASDIGEMMNSTYLFREPLLLYGELNSIQRRMLFSPAGVDLQSLFTGHEEIVDNFFATGSACNCPDPWDVKELKVSETVDEAQTAETPEVVPAPLPAWVSSESVDCRKLVEDASQPLILRCKKIKSEDGGLDYWFTMRVPDSELWLIWQISTPLYVKPDEKEQDKETGSDD